MVVMNEHAIRNLSTHRQYADATACFTTTSAPRTIAPRARTRGRARRRETRGRRLAAGPERRRWWQGSITL